MYKNIIRLALVPFLTTSLVGASMAQTKNIEGSHSVSDSIPVKKKSPIAFSGYAEIWARNTQLNPGSLVNGQSKGSVSDISLRRVRLKMTYKPNERMTFVVQTGTNNANLNTSSSPSILLLDAYGEYKFSKYLQMGGGRSTMRGLSRFTTGPVSTLLYDIPLISISNINYVSENIRELSVYAKGDIGKFNYSLIAANPFTAKTYAAVKDVAKWSQRARGIDYSGYFKYDFLDKESFATPFRPGTYVGKKRVLSLGAGFDYLKNALWYVNNQNITKNVPMKNFAADIFYDAPIDKTQGTSFSFYGLAQHNNYGPNYVEYTGFNNPASGLNSAAGSLNGSGNAFPLIGTGSSYYAQLGGTLPYFNKAKNTLQLQPAASVLINHLQALPTNAVIYDAGVSLLLNGMMSRMTFDAQSRPIYSSLAGGNIAQTSRKWQCILKYRIDFK